MASPMLDRVPPSELAKRDQVIELQGLIEDFDGLVAAIDSELAVLAADERPRQWQSAPVDIRLRFGFSPSQPGVPALRGRIATVIPAVCQRCLGLFELAVDIDLKLLLPAPGVAAEAEDGYDVWELEDAEVRLRDIVDETLVMAMPFASVHASRDDCSGAGGPLPMDKSESQRPFADLKTIMANADKEQ